MLTIMRGHKEILRLENMKLIADTPRENISKLYKDVYRFLNLFLFLFFNFLLK